ncbi:Beta-1,3-galactosyltransferase 2 [Collichthys lucidus]|uniref:Hexosyltransferase n=1 Tax=Collichthys lucidus TaxID=240159 RepID=A0A4U5U806_COLLU|nr:Beta-1,3-galactosyltransferase 2 [Collichthys lucidus]
MGGGRLKENGLYLVEYPYEYHFVINEPNNRADRDIIRNTWGGESPVLDKVVKVFFLLGLRTGDGVAELQEKLLQESKEHRDLIQSDFLDCYKNLTIKTMVMMEWLDKYCSQAAYAMKIDSDMFLNLPNLISMLSNTPKTNYLTGCVAADGPYLVEYPYEYHFVINEPNRCEQEKPFLVLIVPVAPNNRADRDIIRNTWGGESPVLDKVVKVFFLLGLRTGDGVAELQEKLLQESKEHRDLIQSDFLDCYKNLTIKTMVMMEWLDKYCSQAAYAMKIDSDMFLNLPNLISMLSNTPKTNYLTGLVEGAANVRRDQGSKWYLPQEVYPNSRYPPYALGLGYVLSLDLPKKLVEASRHVKAVYIEDVYLGLCMQHLGISPTEPPERGKFHVYPVTYSRCAYSRIIATTTHEHVDRMSVWKDFKRPGPYCN